jgi:PAS domain S-box-containing protein
MTTLELEYADDPTVQSARLQGAIVDSCSDAIIGRDMKSIITCWNAAAERIFGYSASEIIGRSITLIVPPEHYAEEEAVLARITQGERIEHLDTERLRKDGKLVSVCVTASPIKNTHGQLIGASMVARDISERKRAVKEIGDRNDDLEQRVIERTSQLQAVNKELEAFAYSVSHDLRAPLRTLDGFSQALLEDYTDKLDDEGVDNLRRIRNASQRMGHLIDDLLNLSQLTRVEMTLARVDFSQMVLDVIEEVRATEAPREVTTVVAEGLFVDADPRLLRIALTNLFANALKFSGKRPDARIEFGCTYENGEMEYFVRDNGVGFDMAHAGRLFGAFQRLHAMHEFPGTGIGLTIVQRIVNRHGGRVRAQGVIGVGATFYFTL